MTQEPAISVLLPVYNGETFIREAVESILKQSFKDFELLIINDGSTDKSGIILRDLAAADKRILLIERANAGLVSTLNEGINRARGEFIARMDADDVAYPERLERQYKHIIKKPNLGVLGTFINIINGTGEIIRVSNYPVKPKETAQFLEQGCPVAHPTVMMRRKAVLKTGGYRKAFSHCEDYDLWLRMSELGYEIANIPEPLLNYRMHGANVSSMHREAQELGTIIARLCYRARMAGLPDPCDGLTEIHEGMIDAFPRHLRLHIDADIFVQRYRSLSLADKQSLREAWSHYCQLETPIKCDTSLCHFLMRLFYGAIRQKKIFLALRVLIEALFRHPLKAIRMMSNKVKHALPF